MKKHFSFLLILAILACSCQKELNFPISNVGELPVVVTKTLTIISDSSVSVTGEVLSEGSSQVTARGLCWSTGLNPTIADLHTTNGTGPGLFTDTITGLLPSVVYHVRAYATNSTGTAYGADSVFTTSPSTGSLPTVVTARIDSITASTASGGGNVLADGGASVTARGICWGTASNPDINGNHTTDGSGTGSYLSRLNGLAPSTTYHVRAYATNSNGTAYGADSSFTTNARDIYVAGFEYTATSMNAVLWKNGVPSILGTNLARANAVFVSGNDVYVAGSEIENGPVGAVRYAKLWKNGVGTVLGVDFSEAYAVYVSGSDVYVAGYESVGSANAATVWKNGVATHLSNGVVNATLTSVFVNGSDVYYTGNDDTGSKIWKNGIASPLSGLNAPMAVYVSGNDVYVAGHTYNGSGQDRVVLWKNGVSTDLTNGTYYSDAKSVFVSGTDVYVAGFESDGTSLNPIVAKIWKNGSPIVLTGTNASANAVFVSDGDVYAAGTVDLTATSSARYWKNGTATALTNGTNSAEALGIFVR